MEYREPWHGQTLAPKALLKGGGKALASN